MQRRTTLWFLLLFQPFLLTVVAQNATECKIGAVNPLASSSLNACYKLYDTPKSYQAARRHCVSLGGQLAEKINKDDSSLYSANADLNNATQFWVGASNLKCNVNWENGGEIEFNDMWAPESRYYGVAIDKMSLGGLWHTVPVGHQLPFVCTFQGRPKSAGAPVHAMRAPAKKRVSKESEKKEEEEDIDESMNAAQAEEKSKQEAAAASASALTMSASASESASASDSETKTFDAMSASEISDRKEVGQAAVAMMSQEMNARSENYDSYTTEDLLSAAATLMGGYTVNMNWADRSTSTTTDTWTDERSMSLSMTVAEQMAMAMEERSKSESSSSSSDSTSDEISLSMAMEAKSASNDSSSSADSLSMSQKMESQSKDEDEQADVMSAAAILSGKKDATVVLTTTKMPTTEDDIDESLNAALADKKTTTVAPTTVLPKASGCPGQWTQFNANSTAPSLCFRRFEKSMNFEDARLFCLARGGHLASIHNERQLLLLSALLHNIGPDAIDKQTWIGLNRIHQKYYVYEDETAMDFTRWLPGAPNINDCTVFTGNELPNYPHKGTQYKFGDFPCEETQKSVLCEVTMGNDKEKTLPTCQEGWSYYSHDGSVTNGKCYKHIAQPKKFIEARELCRSENSYLASIQNEGESRFVSALVQTSQNYTIKEQTWIGYVKYNDKDYGWEDGSKGVTFDPWTEKLPKDKKCTMFTGNEIHDDCRSKFRFVSVDCDVAQRAVLCSKPPMKDGAPFTYKDTENTSKRV